MPPAPPASAPPADRDSALAISVILPVLNEAGQLASALAAVGAPGPALEVIVVDGGSGDRSDELAASAGVQVLRSPIAQRAAQMNLGAAAAVGDVFVFLHADTVLPAGWADVLRAALQRRPSVVGGVFRRRFACRSAFLRMTCRLADWRARRFGWFLGDQTIFVRRAAFAAIGGYRPLPVFEDLQFSFDLKGRGPTVVLDATTMSSCRRFAARGPLRQTLADLTRTCRFLRERRSSG
jgi:rSAM/selenodomain-associated transferase 2